MTSNSEREPLLPAEAKYGTRHDTCNFISLVTNYWDWAQLCAATICGAMSALIGAVLLVVALLPLSDALFYQQAVFNSTQNNSQVDFYSRQLQQACIITMIRCVVLGCLQFAFEAVNMYVYGLMAVRLTKRLRFKYLEHVFKLDMGFSQNLSGELTSPLDENMNKIRDALENNFPQAVTLSLNIIFSIIISFVIQWDLTLVFLCISIPAVALFFTSTKKSVPMIAQEQSYLARAAQISYEALLCIKTVICFNGQENTAKRYDASVQEAMNISGKRIKFIAIIDALKTQLFDALVVVGISYSAWTMDQSWTVDQGAMLLILIFIATRHCFNVVVINMHVNAVLVAVGCAKQLGQVFSLKSEIEITGGATLEDQTAREIKFHSVTFAYPGRIDTPVLKEFSLDIGTGENIAIVGESGCGKSTVVALLLRLFDPNLGYISMNGHALTSLNICWLRQQFGYVAQEPVLFDMTIKDNLRASDASVTDLQIIQVLEQANAIDFVNDMPLGLNTRVGERGAQLSGGQKQRLAIARALVRDPAIMIFDEATSSLDSCNEALVQEAIERISQHRICITIAHRLSTVLGADQIVVMDSGRIIEQGPPSKLLEQHGVFANLLQQQRIAGPEHIPTSVYHTPANSIEDDYFSLSKSFRHGFYTSNKRSICQTVQRIVALNTPSLCWFVVTVLAVMLRVWRLVLIPVAHSFLVDAFVYPYDVRVHRMTIIALTFLAISFLALFGEVTVFITIPNFADELSSKIREAVFSHFMSQNLEYFEKSGNSSGSLNAKLSTHAANIRESLSSKLPAFITDLLIGIGCLLVALIIDIRLTCISAGFHIILVLLRVAELIWLFRQEKELQPLLDETNLVATEAYANLETVKAFGMENYLLECYKNQYEPLERQQKNRVLVNSCLVATTNCLVVNFSHGVSFCFASFLMINDPSLTIFTVFICCWSTTLAFNRLHQVNTQTQALARFLASCNSLADVLDEPKPQNPTLPLTSLDGDVALKNVRMTYPSRPEVPVLRDLNLRVAAGKVTALVGPSGSGKSSIIQLILGLYQCQKGRVTFGQRCVSDIEPKSLHRLVAVVSQEPILFNMSIWDNVTYGMEIEDVVPEKVILAAKSANIHQFILSLSQAYDTLVGPLGVKLSGGQKQRIAIARALVREPTVLLLDEATAALDTENEKMVQDALENVQHNCTCVMVAHRLSTVQNAHLIVVMSDGKIVEMGSHTELMQAEGLYQQMCMAQNIS